MHYYVSLFIIHSQEHNKEVFEKIVSISKGAIIAELLYYTDDSLIKKKMTNVKVFFDTRLLLQILGYAEDYEVIACRELIGMLNDMSGRLRVFDNTFKELHGIFFAASHEARNGWKGIYRPGDAFDILCRTGCSSSDIELIMSTLEERLEDNNIRMENAPEIDKSMHIDANKLNEMIEERIPYQNQKSRDHDIRALTAINQLRSGKPKKYFESCDAIFITTNSALANAAVRFFNEEIGISDAPVCMPNHVFTMLMWLKTANKKPDLPTEILLANSLAALDPSDLLWDRYISEAERLKNSGAITEDDYYFLARALEAKAILMDITRGDAESITEGTVKDVLRRTKEKLTRDAVEKYRKSDERREAFFGAVKWLVKRGLETIVTLALLLFVVFMISRTDPTIIFQPRWHMDYYLSVAGVGVSALSLVVGWSFRRLIDKGCENISALLEARLRAWMW